MQGLAQDAAFAGLIIDQVWHKTRRLLVYLLTMAPRKRSLSGSLKAPAASVLLENKFVKQLTEDANSLVKELEAWIAMCCVCVFAFSIASRCWQAFALCVLASTITSHSWQACVLHSESHHTAGKHVRFLFLHSASHDSAGGHVSFLFLHSLSHHTAGRHVSDQKPWAPWASPPLMPPSSRHR